jgi:hypothetical protein
VPGVQQEPRDREALRRRLYEPGATPEDFAAYARAVGPDEPPRPATGAREAAEDGPGGGEPPSEQTGVRAAARRRLLPTVAVVVGALAAVVVGTVLTSGVLLPHVAPTASTAPADTRSTTLATRDPGDSMVGRPALVDHGARPHATGDAVAFGPGIVRYTAADGDTVTGVARRFGLCRTDVLLALPYGFTRSDLEAGYVLELEHDTTATRDASGTC